MSVLYFWCRNEKDTRALDPEDITDSNTLAFINSTGQVWYVREINIKSRCPMDLHVRFLQLLWRPDKCGTNISGVGRCVVHGPASVQKEMIVFCKWKRDRFSPPPIAVPAVVLNSSSGELKLYLGCTGSTQHSFVGLRRPNARPNH